MALSVGVRHLVDPAVSDAAAAPPPPAAPVAGQTRPAGCWRRARHGAGRPASGDARRSRLRPRARLRRRLRIGPSGWWSCRRPRCASCSPAWAGRWCTRSCAGSSSSTTRKIRRLATTSCAPRTPPMPRCASPSRLLASRRRPTAPGKRASRRPTRSCSRPTSAPSTSRSATASTRRAIACSSTSSVANRGEDAIGSKLAVSRQRRARTPTSAAAASSRAYRPTWRRRSAYVNGSVERESIESLAQEPDRGQGRDGAAGSRRTRSSSCSRRFPIPRCRRATAPAARCATGTDVGQVTLRFAERAVRAEQRGQLPVHRLRGPQGHGGPRGGPAGRRGGAGRAASGRAPRSTSRRRSTSRLAPVAGPIVSLLKFFHRFTHNWGLAIVLLTLFIKILTFYPTQKSLVSAQEDAEAGAEDGGHPQEVRKRPAAPVGRDHEPLQGARRVAVRRLPAQPDPDADLDRALLDAELRRRAVPRAVRRAHPRPHRQGPVSTSRRW